MNERTEKECENCTFLRKIIHLNKSITYQCINHQAPNIEGLKEKCMFDLGKRKWEKKLMKK